jgi:hypothetical protein
MRPTAVSAYLVSGTAGTLTVCLAHHLGARNRPGRTLVGTAPDHRFGAPHKARRSATKADLIHGEAGDCPSRQGPAPGHRFAPCPRSPAADLDETVPSSETSSIPRIARGRRRSWPFGRVRAAFRPAIQFIAVRPDPCWRPFQADDAGSIPVGRSLRPPGWWYRPHRWTC